MRKGLFGFIGVAVTIATVTIPLMTHVAGQAPMAEFHR
jgi:hypothetical protein